MTIGFQTPWLFGYYFSDMLAGVQRVVRRRGAQLIAVQEDNNHKQAHSISAAPFALGQTDGWIVMQETTLSPQIVRAGIPLVAISAHPEGVDCPIVICDNRGGISDAVNHLIGHGHRRIAFLGTNHYVESAARFEGYRAALYDAGLAFDPELVFTASSQPDDAKYRAAIAAVAESMAAMAHMFSACVASDDDLAIGLVKTLQAADFRVPEDVAVIGFNDIPDAQYLTPPLTTISQGFDNLGSAAAELLMNLLDGATVPAVTYVPTKLRIRRSCGCSATSDLLPYAPHDPLADWQTDLARRLVEPLLFPATLPASTPPTDLWPGVATLVQAIAAARDGALPSQEVCRQAFEGAIALTSDFKTLRSVMKLLEQAVYRHVESAADSGQPGQRGSVLLDIFHIALLYAYREHEQATVQLSDTLLQVNVTINQSLFGNQLAEILTLKWLDPTFVTWGALALWDRSGAQGETLRIVGTYSREPQALLAMNGRYSIERFPPADQLPATARDAGQDTIKAAPGLVGSP
jgi:DNA-binding LacI/PurR family transcriptional regulator